VLKIVLNKGITKKSLNKLLIQIGEDVMKNFHCCATCVNFVVKREEKENKIEYYCKRLGFETKSHYVFNCWEPKENVKKLIDKQKKLQF